MTEESQVQPENPELSKGGAKTEAGKAVSRMNAVSHGLLSREVLLPGESARTLGKLRKDLMAELQPVGELETILVERIVASTWRLKRVLRAEKRYTHPPEQILIKKGVTSTADYRYGSWQNYSRYESAVERQIYKAMHELERLQNIRRGASQTPPPVEDEASTGTL